jgi:peptidoglycan/LPS O-acetylase OafA/YrhL
MLYFNIGIILASHTNFNNLYDKLSHYKYIIFLFAITINIFFIIFNVKVGYWQGIGIIYILIMILALFLLSFSKIFNNKNFISIGKNSMAYYLIHMPIAGIIVRIFNINGLLIFQILKPFLVMIIVYLVLNVFVKFLKIMKVEKLSYIVGLR